MWPFVADELGDLAPNVNQSSIILVVISSTVTLIATWLTARGKTRDPATQLIDRLQAEIERLDRKADRLAEQTEECEREREADREAHDREMAEVREQLAGTVASLRTADNRIAQLERELRR